MKQDYKINALGESAITIDFGNLIDETINKQVIALFHLLQQQSISGVRDIIPCYSSLTIVYDPLHAALQEDFSGNYTFFKNILEQSIKNMPVKKEMPAAVIKIPVCYHQTLAPDLNLVSAKTNLAAEEIIQLHCDKIYRVYMIGFLPGFAYMGKTNERIAVPRKEMPAPLVLSGSVGLAGMQTGIYPLDSPGGWNIIGQTPLKMFDAKRQNAVLLEPGDRVQFVSISLQEFNNRRVETTHHSS
ncbi:MAG: 5-oxoprolinase subunit PxpB [Chitinophagaceae bacterium]|nr:5-oxoprolinase subunit PxpB [Chitinophagaceae bacterium]